MSQNLINHSIKDNIPIFAFHKITPPALDEYLEIAMPFLLQHIEKYQERVPFCYVIDLSKSGMFPVKLMMDKAKKVLATLEKDPVHFVAYVIDDPRDQMLLSILDMLAVRQMEHTRKVFTPEKLSEAIAWLKEMEAPYLEKERQR